MLFAAANYFLIAFIIIVPVYYLLFVLRQLRCLLRDAGLPALLFLFLTMVFLRGLLFSPDAALVQPDYNNIQLVFFQFLHDSILHYGAPPIWHSGFGGGFDAFANPLAAYFSPFAFFFLLTENMHAAFALFLSGHVFLCLIFFYALFRSFSFDRRASSIGAVIAVFNAFLTARLSPGVGIEYFYTYTWLPLTLVLTKTCSDEKNKRGIAALAISLVFLGEGNPNIAIACGCIWGIFVFYCRPRGGMIKYFFCAPLISLGIFALKIIPAIDLMLSTDGRLSQAVSGWRATRISAADIAGLFMPLQYGGHAMFSPGFCALFLTFFGLWSLLIALLRGRKAVGMSAGGFALILLFTGMLLISDNFFSDTFFGLPLMERLTILPSFIPLLLLPTAIFGAIGFQHASGCFSVQKRAGTAAIKIFFIAAVVLIFSETAFGPPALRLLQPLGILKSRESYRFSFPTYSWRKEAAVFEPFASLAKLPAGHCIETQTPALLLRPYPGQIVASGLYTLNAPGSFFGPTNGQRLVGDFDALMCRADYIVSPFRIRDAKARLISRMDMASIKKNPLFIHCMNHRTYKNFRTSMNWDEKIYIYKTASSRQALRKLDNDPFYFRCAIDARNCFDTPGVPTVISYSKWWRDSNGKGKIEKDSYGYIFLPQKDVQDIVELWYVNYAIYYGLVISFLFLAMIALL